MTSFGLIVRTLACFALVFATWNPSGYDYWSWLHGDATTAAKALVGTGLLAIHILFARIAWLSLGPAGVVGGLVVLLTGILALSETGAVDLGSRLTRDYLVLIAVSMLLASGVTWSLVKRRVTGQSNYLNPPP